MRSFIPFFLCISLLIVTSDFAHADIKKNKHVTSSSYALKAKKTVTLKEGEKNISSARIENWWEEEDVTLIKHKIKKGETVAKISKMYGVSVEEIKAVNGLKTDKLIAGRIILIPQERKEEIVEFSQTSYGEWKDPEERYMLVKVAKSFVGAPYKLGGSTVRGLDCSAFVKKIFEIFDVNLPRTAREQYAVGKKIGKEELTTGDLVFFKTRAGSRGPTHVGIYIGNGKFIHASSHQRRGVRIDNLDAPFYRRTYVGAVRVKELPGQVVEGKDRPASDGNS